MSENRSSLQRGDLRAEPDEAAGVTIDDFVAYMPAACLHLHAVPRALARPSVNARLPPRSGADQERPAEARQERQANHIVGHATGSTTTAASNRLTWHPGLPMLITDRLVGRRRLDRAQGRHRASTCTGRRASSWATPARQALGSSTCTRFTRTMPTTSFAGWRIAVQQPGDKINHALVLGGDQGIGKDTLLEPVKHAVGPWNFHEISPTHLLGPLQRLREIGDPAGQRRRAISAMSTASSSTTTPRSTPPRRPTCCGSTRSTCSEYYVLNCLGFIITTNHKTDGIYLPADDRRHYVAWSNLNKGDFPANYWNELWGFYENGGLGTSPPI